jgi:MFS family permease
MRAGFYGGFVLSAPSTRLVVASGCSNLGDGLWAVALPLLAAAATADPFAVAAVFAAGQVPWLAVAVWGGGVVDRRNRVDLLRRINTLRVVMVVGLAASVAIGGPGIGVLLAAALLIGTCEAMVDTATEALVPAVAQETDLARVNGRLLSAQIAGNELVGPALGGVLFAVAAWVPLFANAALLMAAVALLLTIPSLLGIVHRMNDTTATRWSDGVSSTTARQTIVPASSLGRVAASFRGVSIAAAIAGALLGGWIAAVGSLTVALVIAGVAALVAAVPVTKSLSAAFAT